MRGYRRSLKYGTGTIVAQAWNLSEYVLLYEPASGQIGEVRLPRGMTLEECISDEGGWSEFASFEIGPAAYTYLRRSLVRGVYVLPQIAIDQMVFPELRDKPWSVVQMTYQLPLAESGHRGRPSEYDISVMKPIPVSEMQTILDAPAIRPPAPVSSTAPPTTEQLSTALASNPLASSAENIVALARPQWFALEASEAEPSSFLLDPSGAASGPTPVFALDLAEAYVGLDLPRQGALIFSYDAYSKPWGDEPADAGSFSVMLSQASAREAAEASGLRPIAIRLVEGIGLPAIDSLPGDLLPIDSDDEAEAYLELLEELFGEPGSTGGAPGTWLGGYPYQLQDDMQEQCAEMAKSAWGLESEPAEWRLLLQLASESAANMCWEDDGFLYYWIRESDLASHDFSHAWCILQTM